MPDPVELLTLPEAAERLKVSRRGLARLVANRELPSVRIGRRRLITSRAIAAYVAAHERWVA